VIFRIINEYKEAAQVTKENTPKILVIFPLLLEYFGEKTNFLFKIISVKLDFLLLILVLKVQDDKGLHHYYRLTKQTRMYPQLQIPITLF